MATYEYRKDEPFDLMQNAGLSWWGNNSQYQGAYDPSVNKPATTTPATTAPATTTPAATTTTTTKPATSSGGGGGSSTTTAAPPMQAVDPSKTVDRSQQEANYNAYIAAMQKLEEMGNNAPGAYENQYATALDAIYGQIMNRDAFSYNLNEDQLYQQYRDKYMAQADMSMRDTMGQAAALTGGYGSSYGQMVGQQAYDAQIQKLNDIVPDLYDRAYGHWQDEGNRMWQNYNALLDREAIDYSRYQDDLSKYYMERDYLNNSADDAYKKYLTERDYADTQEKTLLAERDANLQKLLGLAQYGYSPSAQEIADAGITPTQWQYYLKSVTSSGGGGGGSKSKTLKDYANELLNAGYSAGQVNSMLQSAYNDSNGKYSVSEVRDAFITNTPANATVYGPLDYTKWTDTAARIKYERDFLT